MKKTDRARLARVPKESPAPRSPAKESDGVPRAMERRPASGGLGSGGEGYGLRRHPPEATPAATRKQDDSLFTEARAARRHVPALDALRTLHGKTVRLLRDADGAPHFVSPLVLPKVRGREAADRLRHYRHDALLPICEVIGTGGKLEQFQEQAIGTTLDRCFAELSGDVIGGEAIDYWDASLDGGAHGLVRSFARLAELCHDLLEREALPPLRPERILVSPERGLLLRAGDILRDGFSRDGVQAALRDLLYCPPEIFLSAGDAPHTIREEQVVYTLAALLFHSLTGGPPFPGRDAAEVADRILSGSGPSTSRWPQTLPPAVWEVLTDALDVEPRRRPATLHVFAVTIVAALEGKGDTSHGRGKVAFAWLTRRRLLWGAAVLAVAFFATHQMYDRDRRRDHLEARMAAVLDLRPLPVALEDPIGHVGAQLILLDNESDLAAWPADARLHLYRGWAELRCGDHAEAMRAFQLALRFRSDSLPAQVSLAICRAERGDARGKNDLAAALRRTPQDATDWFFHGAALFYREDFAAAATAFAKASDYGDGSPGALHRALCGLYVGAFEDAYAALREAEAKRPHDPWLLWIYAELAAARGDRLQSQAYLERLKLRAPSNAPLLLRGGLLLERLGCPDESKRWLADAARGRPEGLQVEALSNGRVRAVGGTLPAFLRQ